MHSQWSVLTFSPASASFLTPLPFCSHSDRLVDLADRLVSSGDILDAPEQPLETSLAFHLHTNFPRVLLTRAQADETLLSLGLYPSSNLICVAAAPGSDAFVGSSLGGASNTAGAPATRSMFCRIGALARRAVAWWRPAAAPSPAPPPLDSNPLARPPVSATNLLPPPPAKVQVASSHTANQASLTKPYLRDNGNTVTYEDDESKK